MELSGYFTIKQAVSDVLNDKFGTIDDARYFQLMRWAQRQMVQLKIHVLPQNKPVKLSVTMNPYSVKLPDDYVNFRAVGKDYNGQFVPFDRMETMATFVGEDCGQEDQGTDETVTTTFATQIQSWYKYQLDEQNQRILLQGYPYLDDVILLYVSSGVTIGGNTVIPAKIYEVMIAWLNYMLEKHSGGTGIAIQEAWNTYEREMNKYQKTKIKLDDMYAVLFDVANDKKYPVI